MEGVKIYGLCLERIRHQIGNAKSKTFVDRTAPADRVLLESYNTGDVEDLIDILELYDINDRTMEGVLEKLEELAFTVSNLARESLSFDITADGHMGLYLSFSAVPGGSSASTKTESRVEQGLPIMS